MAAIKPPPLPTPQRITFHQGWHWLISAANQVALAPWLYLPALSWLLLVGSLQWIIPGASSFLSGLLAPLSIAPLLLTYEQQEQHLIDQELYRQQPQHLFQRVFATHRFLPLLRLGFYLMLVVLVLSQICGWTLSRMLDDDVLAALARQDLNHLAMTPKHELMLILVLTALPMAALGLLAWLSIPLVLFYSTPIPQVLALAIRSTLRNWRALLALNILLIVVCVGVVLMLLIANMVGHAISPQVGVVLSTLLLFAFTCFMQIVLVGAQYLSCRDIFPRDNDRDPDHPSSTEDHQRTAANKNTSDQAHWQA